MAEGKMSADTMPSSKLEERFQGGQISKEVKANSTLRGRGERLISYFPIFMRCLYA